MNWEKITSVLAGIGAVNWGLFAINPTAELVQYLSVNWLITLIYALVGVSGVMVLIKAFKK